MISDRLQSRDSRSPAAALLPGGALQKASLLAYDGESGDELKQLHVTFFLNPSNVRIVKTAQLEEQRTFGSTRETRWTANLPIELELSDLWFDTYEDRENVRTRYIEPLERLMEPGSRGSAPPWLRLRWGGFTHGSKLGQSYTFLLEGLVVDYSMFLPDGTPVRAKVQLRLKQTWPIDKQTTERPGTPSSDPSMVIVRQGDTLQGLAAQHYKEPRAWRRIADANDIDDPMNLRPGTPLVIPRSA